MGGVRGLVRTDQEMSEGGSPSHTGRGTEKKRKVRLRQHTKVRQSSVTPDLLSEDMAMERERRQWERDQAKELDKPLGPVHYQEMRQGGTERQLI